MARKKKRKKKQTVVSAHERSCERALQGQSMPIPINPQPPQHPNCCCVTTPIITDLPDFAEMQRIIVAEVARNLSLPPELLRTAASMEGQSMPIINTTPIGPSLLGSSFPGSLLGSSFPGYWSGQYRDEAQVEMSLRFYDENAARSLHIPLP
jgi:hypothetical protein